MERTNEEVEIEGEQEGGTGLESPFIVKKRQKQSYTRPRKKQKSNKSVNTTPLVLMEGDLDEIGDVVRDATKNIWSHIKDQYHQTLDKMS